MSAIRSVDTKPELLLRSTLRRRGLVGYRINHRLLPGRPDVVYTRWRLAIFVDGAFWHGHPDHFNPATAAPYWRAKIERTRARDLTQVQALEDLGFHVLRVWDFDLLQDPEAIVDRIEALLSEARSEGGQASSSEVAKDK